jgi:hypothetical protein
MSERIRARIDIINDERACELVEQTVATAEDERRARARRREAQQEVGGEVDTVVGALVEADPEALAALAALASRLDSVRLGSPVEFSDVSYTEGVVFHAPPYGDVWREGEAGDVTATPETGRFVLSQHAGEADGASYGTHGGAAGWSFVFTTNVRARVQIRPYLQYSYGYSLGTAGSASARIRGALKLRATGFVGWGSNSGLGGGGSFHAENAREIFSDQADSHWRNEYGDGNVADLWLEFNVEPGRPTVVKVGAEVECAAENSHVAGFAIGHSTVYGRVDVSLRWAFIESHPA